MNVYLDTSALVKLYIEEVHHKKVRRVVEKAKITATHVIAYVETYAAFARLYREARLSTPQFEKIKATFENDWPSFLRIECDEMLLRRAREMAEVFALRAYDSVHLSALEFLQKQSEAEVLFACFDDRLNNSAKILGCALL